MSPLRALTQTFELHDRQKEVRDTLAGPERHCLIYGGSRSGKTFLFCYATAVRALSARESRHLIARLHNVDVNQSVLMDTWPKMMRLAFPGVSFRTNKKDQFVTLQNGSEIWFGGLDDKERVDKILGKEFATIYVNEASQVSFAAVLTLRTRLAQISTKVNGKPLVQKAYYDLNPVGRSHWTYREFVKGVRPDNALPVTPGTRCYRVMNPGDNPALDQAYLDELAALPDRQRKRFLEGEYLSEVPGALWSLDRIDELRVAIAQPLRRIVVAIDPAATSGDDADESGIIVAGLGEDGHGYVLHDGSLNGTPDEVCRMAVRLYHLWGADRIVAEGNNGGDWIESLLRTADPNIAYRKVTASRGKVTRAEPASSLYEQGRVHHVGSFPSLEDQQCAFTTDFDRKSAGYSPDRVDALVWALTELFSAPGISFATL